MVQRINQMIRCLVAVWLLRSFIWTSRMIVTLTCHLSSYCSLTIFFQLYSCRHPMALLITSIECQLRLQFSPLMEGTCKFEYFLSFYRLLWMWIYGPFMSWFLMCRFGQPIKVNWAYASNQREDTSGFVLISQLCSLVYQSFSLPLGWADSMALVWRVPCFASQGTIIFLSVTLVLKSQMPHCFLAFLFIPVARKLCYVFFFGGPSLLFFIIDVEVQMLIRKKIIIWRYDMQREFNILLLSDIWFKWNVFFLLGMPG